MATFKEIHALIQSEIEAGSLWRAIGLLKKVVEKLGDNSDREELRRIESTYNYMTDFLLRNSPDPERERVYDNLCVRLQGLNDSMLISSRIDTAPEVYFATARLYRLNNRTLRSIYDDFVKYESVASIMAESEQKDVQLLKKKEQALNDLFEWIWVSGELGRDDSLLLRELSTDKAQPFELRAQIAAALFMALLQRYDAVKMDLLLELSEQLDDEAIAARALTMATLLMPRYARRIELDPKLRARLELWQDSLLQYSRLRTVIQALLRAFDTDRLTRQVQQDMMPEFMKLQPQFRKIFGEAAEKGLTPDDLQSNPEWEELLDKSGLREKLESLSEMQQEGGDVMIGPMAGLKRFPFFQKISNWFLPFNANRSEFASPEVLEGVQDFFNVREGVICDSDLYSLLFSITMMKNEAVTSKLKAMSEQLSQYGKEMLDELHANPEFNGETDGFVKDLYRFFRLNPHAKEFPDLFATPLNPAQLPVIGEEIADDEMLRLLLEFFLKRGYFEEALDAVLLLIAHSEPDESLYQKAGYCLMELGRVAEGVEYLKRAELMNAESEWLMTNIGWALHMLGRPLESADYYKRALDLPHDESADAQILFAIGLNLSEAGKFKEALKYFYQSHYQHPEHTFAMRGIAWTEFLLRNYETSLDYSRRLIDGENPDLNDFMNAGTACFALGRYDEAYKYYMESVERREGDDRVKAYEDFRDELDDDLPHLEELGLPMKDLAIILDKVRKEVVS